MPAGRRRQRTDRVVVTLLAFFTVFNLVLDLWYVRHARELDALAGRHVLADWWAVYASADRFWVVSDWSFAQEAFNVFVTTLVNVWLMWAIVRRAPYRHALQLALAAYMVYSVLLYFLSAHVGGYPGMAERTVANLALFYGVTLPWLLAHVYIGWDAFRTITAQFSDW
jgi:emopamil binding protein